MEHRRNRSLDSDSPTSPISRSGSARFRSPLSLLRRQVAAFPVEGSRSNDGEKPLPLNPFDPLAVRTPYRNRSSRATAVQVHAPSHISSCAASLSDLNSDSDSEDTILDSYPTAPYAAAPLRRVWSAPDIEWPTAKAGTLDVEDEGEDITSFSTSHGRPLAIRQSTEVGPFLRSPSLIRQPTRRTPTPAPTPTPTPTSTPVTLPVPVPTPPPKHIAHIIAPSPISPTSARPRPLSLVGLPVEIEVPVLPRSEPSPLRRSHAISRRPSPTMQASDQECSVAQTARPQSVSLTANPRTVSASRKGHTYSQSLSVHSSGPIVSNSPHPGAHKSLPPPAPHAQTFFPRRYSYTMLERSAAEQSHRPGPSPMAMRSATAAAVVWAASEAATYTHVLLRASALAQHLADRRVKSATVCAMLAFLNARPDDPWQLSVLLNGLQWALLEDGIVGGLGSLLDRLLFHLSAARGFSKLFTTHFIMRRTCTLCGADTHSTTIAWAAPYIDASVTGVRPIDAVCRTCGTTAHFERWGPAAHRPLLLIEPNKYVIEKMVDRGAGVEWALVGAAVPVDRGLGFIAMEGPWTLFKGAERVAVDLRQPVPSVFALYQRVTV
ncbi:uncharacterized protein CcaverHIS019_0203820 [Cutaneotrichosporon cavernicola]|uniref:Uncharacterized protein n=1 Tax=Cutaneotrichosporon cavernicola TaxID=279322 RepID=A0AA48I6Z9_9TREE|nr:uncharacterized protein CcaverHIS019_0203820 [Cutaneotrichosporon cavernicola]BEI89020.1 hypothetical protein CcaverHIS019_0203820 [Cutaneotrichosporon cavernicola]